MRGLPKSATPKDSFVRDMQALGSWAMEAFCNISMLVGFIYLLVRFVILIG